ncbi:MAG: endonuclease [Chryseobacterium sp.]|jgi:endonuclease-8|uniref:DNA-formamidopyrimidine glycosylase family protein n=1 Tax=Chryseobacterium sp. TaxID=1871047 RepID=UPI0026040CCE|nr:DNA-formamidopyrimidine glycosylase family protein [Chryseobacterium sp.]MDF2552317.1 endonuclease [Chryseobacterium sp.]
MPEGPTIVLMKEDLQKFVGKKVIEVNGSEVPENSEIKGEVLREIKIFGKQTYLIFDKIIFKIHLMMFGSYSLYNRKDIDTLKLGLTFKDGGMYFYTCVVKVIDESYLLKIDWEADIMSDRWNPEKTEKTLKAAPKMMICDALMNQDIFSGVGNIIKNEALFRVGIHPESLIGNLPPKKLQEIIAEARNYGFDFKKWKKANVLSKHFQIYHQKNCPICGAATVKKDTGKSKRTSFFCKNDQKLY